MKRLYIIHGWAYSTDKWDELLRWLPRHGAQGVMLKVPGLTVPTDEPWDTERYVSWLHEQTQGESDPFALLGHSNGGRIALNFAQRHPGRLRHLILVDSAGIYHDEPPLRLKRALFGAAARAGKRLTSSERLRHLLYRLARAGDYEQAPPHMRQTMVNLQDSDRQLDLAHIDVPTTIIWGAADTITPLSDGQTLLKRLPHAELHVIEGARHAPFFTHAERVGEIIVEALQ